MSMLGCSCGKTIYDNTDHLPYKGHAIADTEWFELFDRISNEVAGYIRARVAGTERQWLPAGSPVQKWMGADEPYE